MKAIRCLLSSATRCVHFKSGECMSPVKCKYQMELISVKFPETIFMPTKEACEKMQAEIVRLTAENAALRERLDKAIELPFENLDKVFILAGEDAKAKQFIPDRIVEGTIVGFGYDVYEWVNGNYKFNYHVLVGENNYIFALEQFNKTLFKTREAAEARLKEIKEEI